MRHLGAHERDILVVATLGNLNWCDERFSRDDITSRSEFARYTRLLPARGDFGYVAERNAEANGVVWLQFHPCDDAGYGFVNEGIPELSIWVCSTWRGKGLGRTLIREALREARKRKLPAVSLSVEADNFAKKLYLDEGFVDVPGRDADGVMLWSRASK